MESNSPGWWKSFERFSPQVFFGAGVLLFGFAAISAIEAFTALSPPALLGVSLGVFGLIAPVFGLLGLYPRFRKPAPRLSRGGVEAILAATVGILVVFGWFIAAGIPEPQNVPGMLTLLAVISVVLIAGAFLLFAAASLRTAIPSRWFGILLLIPVALWIWHFAITSVYESSAFFSFTDYTMISLAFLALGYRLQKLSRGTRNLDPSPDSTA